MMITAFPFVGIAYTYGTIDNSEKCSCRYMDMYMYMIWMTIKCT